MRSGERAQDLKKTHYCIGNILNMSRLPVISIKITRRQLIPPFFFISHASTLDAAVQVPGQTHVTQANESLLTLVNNLYLAIKLQVQLLCDNHNKPQYVAPLVVVCVCVCVLCIPHRNVSQQQLLCGVMCISIFHSGASKAAAIALNYINTDRVGCGGSVIKDTNNTHTDGQLLTCTYVPAQASAGWRRSQLYNENYVKFPGVCVQFFE